MKIKPVTGPNRQRLLEVLKRMRDVGPDPYQSICCQMPNRELFCLCRRLIGNWPDRTRMPMGNKTYVVGSAAKYRHESVTGTFWTNPRRHAALHWLITHLDQELNLG